MPHNDISVQLNAQYDAVSKEAALKLATASNLTMIAFNHILSAIEHCSDAVILLASAIPKVSMIQLPKGSFSNCNRFALKDGLPVALKEYWGDKKPLTKEYTDLATGVAKQKVLNLEQLNCIISMLSGGDGALEEFVTKIKTLPREQLKQDLFTGCGRFGFDMEGYPCAVKEAWEMVSE